jgi:hypothetical protein
MNDICYEPRLSPPILHALDELPHAHPADTHCGDCDRRWHRSQKTLPPLQLRHSDIDTSITATTLYHGHRYDHGVLKLLSACVKNENASLQHLVLLAQLFYPPKNPGWCRCIEIYNN